MNRIAKKLERLNSIRLQTGITGDLYKNISDDCATYCEEKIMEMHPSITQLIEGIGDDVLTDMILQFLTDFLADYVDEDTLASTNINLLAEQLVVTMHEY